MTEPDGSVKPSRKDLAQARRQQLLDAACTMIFERGYGPVSIADIGAAAHVSGPAIYRHFASKADLLAVLCNQTIDRLIELVGPRRSDPTDELAALITGQVRLTVRHWQLVRVFSDEERSLPDEMRRMVRRREREHAQRWVDALRALAPAERLTELEMSAFATVGMILSAARWPQALRGDPGLERALVAGAWRILAPLANDPTNEPSIRSRPTRAFPQWSAAGDVNRRNLR